MKCLSWMMKCVKLLITGDPLLIREIAIRNKTVFLIDDGLLKVKQGITTTEEVLRVALIE